MDSSAWEYHKETIRDLYLVKNKTTKKVMEVMDSEYNFKADIKQYGRWFKK
ncbi:uncharacterized protein K452DRAFT_260630 [Aplosporella prunicola CBS 121167]|uniref:Clr5 domain-containing protein n=1 Tax=Aplosporella prunicola CBS 121167 TaxID=1176127 RepID=A0A6A6AV41_9PEZI|nr:uncharacterized protein K452DRAFT_260630 [Aplosporella prunicola CBS 121167]KAF2135466.1 hypothetical protein K452DRAFT_260630 [Aplosporella prunicola CBS 121167]